MTETHPEKLLIGYARVSTYGQTLDSQLEQLRKAGCASRNTGTGGGGELSNYPDGRFAVQFNGTALDFKVFDKIQTLQPGAIVENKRLSAVLEHIKVQQAAYPARQQRGHVARRRPPNNLEAPGVPSKGRAPRHGAVAAPA